MRSTPFTSVEDWINRQLRRDLHVSAVTIAEVLVGIERLPEGARKRTLVFRFDEMLALRFPTRVLDFDHLSAIEFAKVAVRRERIGRRTEVPDAQIAAICLAHGATLATRNVRDFEETGVTLINPWDQ